MRQDNWSRMLVFFVSAVFFTSLATGFGYMKGTEQASVAPGETASFTFHVFGEEGVVELAETTAPEGWTVQVSPEEVQLPPEEGFRYRQTADGYAKIVPVTVSVGVPADAVGGSYTVVTAFEQVGGSGGEGSSYTVTQSKDFRFTVAVEGGDDEVMETESGENETEETQQEQVSEAVQESSQTVNESGTGEAADERSNGSTVDETGDGSMDWMTVGIIVFEVLWVIAIVYLVKQRFF